MLTDDDKLWFRSEIVASERRILAVIDDRIAASEQRMTAVIDSKIAASEERMLENMRAIETKLLTAFHGWASPVETRQRTHSATLRSIDIEIEALNDRVAKLERRVSPS